MWDKIVLYVPLAAFIVIILVREVLYRQRERQHVAACNRARKHAFDVGYECGWDDARLPQDALDNWTTNWQRTKNPWEGD